MQQAPEQRLDARAILIPASTTSASAPRLPNPLSSRLRNTLLRLRRPDKREWLFLLALPPALLVIWVLVLIPFTPGISDIRKAHEEAPALILPTDGQTLAEFKRGNRDWVSLSDISPRVIDALVATE